MKISSLKQQSYESGGKQGLYKSYDENSEECKLPFFHLHPGSVCPCEQYTDYRLLPPSSSDHPAEQVTLAHSKMEDANNKEMEISQVTWFIFKQCQPSQLNNRKAMKQMISVLWQLFCISCSFHFSIVFQSRRTFIMNSSSCLEKGRVWFFTFLLFYMKV